jgi:hypothetical protein
MPSISKKAQNRELSAARQPRLNVINRAPRAEDLAVFNAPNANPVTFRATTRLDAGAVQGTVGAAMPAVESLSYGSGSPALLRNAPLGEAPRASPAVAPGIRASLITELREISGQVNRMMAQVDRAIHRLGEHAGEPLRR